MENVVHRGVLDRPEVLQLFASQFGVATVRQLVAVGVSERAIGRARQRGVIAAVLPGCARARGLSADLPAARDGRPARSAERRAASTGRPPAQLLRTARDAEPSDPACHVRTTTGTSAARLAATDVQHVGSISSRGRHRRDDGLRVRRAAADAARPWPHGSTDFRFERAAEDAWHLRLISPAARPPTSSAVASRDRADSVSRRMRAVARACRSAGLGRAQSGFELKVARARGARPVFRNLCRQHPLTLANGEVIHLDLAWPEHHARLRTRTLVVARRRPRPACRPAAAPGLRGGRLACRVLRRVGGDAISQLSGPRSRRSTISAAACSAPRDRVASPWSL